MFTIKLRNVSFWFSVATGGMIPLVPVVFKCLYPPKAVKVEQSVEGLASFVLNILGGMGDGILVMLWMSGFAAAAVVASLVAFTAAWVARESRCTRILCLLPALLVVIALGVLVAIGA